MTAEVPSLSLKAQSGHKGLWQLWLCPDMLCMHADDNSQSINIARQDFPEKLEILTPSFSKPILILRLRKKMVFLLESDQLNVLQEWLGPPTTKDLKVALKKRLKFAIPIGLLFLLFSIPMAGDPDTGLEPVPFDPVSAILGALFISLGLIMKFWPRRELFLFDAVWLVLLAAKITYDIIYGSHWLWLLLILVLLFSAREAMKLFKRFKTIQPEVSPYHTNSHNGYTPPSHSDIMTSDES